MADNSDKYPLALGQLPDYMVPFDSEHALPNYAEQLQATSVLRSAIEDKVLETIHRLSPASENDGTFSRVVLDSFDFNGDPVVIEIDCIDNVTHPELPPYCVQFFEGPKRLDGSYLRCHHYTVPYIYSDEGVTRRDVDLVKFPDLEQTNIKPRKYPIPIAEAVGIIIEGFEVAQRALAEEKRLGLNDQPIGILEAKNISLIISRSKPESASRILRKKNSKS